MSGVANISFQHNAPKVINFRADDKQQVQYRPAPVITRPPMNDQVILQKMIQEEQKKEKKQKLKQNLSWGISIASGIAIIAMVLAQFKMLKGGGGGKVPGGFNLSNLEFKNLKNDNSIADIKETKTLSKKVQEFFVEMLESTGINEKYIKRAGLGEKGFPNAGLLLGPSGTGKTESVKMYAKKADADFLVIKLGDFANSYVDGTATNMTKMFKELDNLFKKNPNKKYVILFDEADGIAKKLDKIGSEQDYLNKNRQAFLTGCDILLPNKNVKVFAATNVSLSEMDEAVVSRFGKNIEFELPNGFQLTEGLKFHLKDCEGLKDEKGFDFFTTQKDKLSELIELMCERKYAFRDLQKMTADAQALYAKDMNDKKADLLFDTKYIKEAMERKGKNAAEIAA